MANKKITELPTASTPDGNELVEVVQGGVNKKVTTQDIADLGGGTQDLQQVLTAGATLTGDNVINTDGNNLYIQDGASSYIGLLSDGTVRLQSLQEIIVVGDAATVTINGDSGSTGEGLVSDGAGGVVWGSTGGGSISDAAYSSSWNGNTTDGASKNALYDKIQTISERVYNVETYGAMHDYQTVSDASITSGTDALTTTGSVFTAADVGKSIRVFGAGAAGADLLTTIDGYTSSTSVSIATNASTTISAKQIEWGNDDTQEIQSAIDAAFAANGGTVYFPSGRYLLFGALQTSVNSVNPNCQIYIPLTPNSTQLVSIKLIGETQVPLTWGPFVSVGQPTTGVQLISVIVGSGTLPSVIGSPFENDGFTDTNRTVVQIENIAIRVKSLTGTTHIAPIMTAFNLGYLSAKQVKNDYAFTESNPTVSIEPVAETYGFLLSRTSHDDYRSLAVNITSCGFYYGFRVEEHDSWVSMNAFNCIGGVRINGAGGHPIFGMGNINVHWCRYGVVFTGNADVDIKYKGERWPGAFTSRWYDGVADIYFPSSVEIDGKLSASVDVAGTGSGSIIMSGTNTGNLVTTDVPAGISYGVSDKMINLDGTGNEMIGVTGTGNDLISITGTGVGRSGFRARATNAGGQATNYLLNDRTVFTSYGGQLYGGSTNAVGNLFGVSRADKYFIFADGASNLGMAIGTLSAQPLILGTDNTNRFQIGSAGQLGIGGATYGTSGQVLTSAGSGAAPTWTDKAQEDITGGVVAKETRSSASTTHRTYETLWIDATGTSVTQDINILNGYTDATALIEFTGIGIKSDGSESVAYKYAAAFNKDGATTVVQVGATQALMTPLETDAGASMTISVASNLIRVVVDSGDADSYRWTVFAKVTITQL